MGAILALIVCFLLVVLYLDYLDAGPDGHMSLLGRLTKALEDKLGVAVRTLTKRPPPSLSSDDNCDPGDGGDMDLEEGGKGDDADMASRVPELADPTTSGKRPRLRPRLRSRLRLRRRRSHDSKTR